jgi:hypothetical protein
MLDCTQGLFFYCSCVENLLEILIASLLHKRYYFSGSCVEHIINFDHMLIHKTCYYFSSCVY